MKKQKDFLLSGIAIFSLFLSVSCSKQYNCRCETNDGFVTSSEISEGSRDKSEKKCKEMEYTNTQIVGGQTVTTTNTCGLQ
ncbi:MAG: hypothetical protein ACK4K0_04555 [Flavobacteriales bacterium]